MKKLMSIYNKENSIGILKDMPVTLEMESADPADKIYQVLKSNTDSLHFQKHEDFEAFEVPTSLLNGRRVGNQIRPMISELMKKADILEVIIHR